MFTKVSDEFAPDKQIPHGSTQAAVESEAARMARLLKCDLFSYQPSAKLGAARQRLADLKSEREQQGRRASVLQQAADETQAALLKAQTSLAMGDAKPADVLAAQALHETARANLAANSPNSEALKNEIANVVALVESLEQQELNDNVARLRPLYRKAVAKLDKALEAARLASDELRALKHVGARASQYWPGEWGELSPTLMVGVRNDCHLDSWRKQAREAGLLD